MKFFRLWTQYKQHNFYMTIFRRSSKPKSDSEVGLRFLMMSPKQPLVPKHKASETCMTRLAAKDELPSVAILLENIQCALFMDANYMDSTREFHFTDRPQKTFWQRAIAQPDTFLKRFVTTSQKAETNPISLFSI